MEEKAAFRKQALKARNLIADRESKSDLIAEYVLGTEQFQQAKTVFIYLSYRFEVETRKIIEAAFKQGKRAVVPKVEGKRMQFYEIRSLADVSAGYKGILEPAVCECAVVPQEGDLMLVPGAAFADGYRVGYGGGFYDRYFSEHHQAYIKAGLAFSEQIYEQVPKEEHDVRIDVVITEKGAVWYEDNIADCWKD